MLSQILSSEKLKGAKGGSGLEEKRDLKSESSQFSQILQSLDKDAVAPAKPLKSGEVMDNLKSLFDDDKEFFKETFSFLNKGDGFSGEETTDSSLFNGKDLPESPKFMLNIGSGSVVPVEPKVADLEMKVLIHEAKEFLKKELVKHSVSEKEMPNTLRGLVSLASTKGISVKDVKFSPENVQKIAQGETSHTVFEFGKGVQEPSKQKRVVHTASTDSFLQSRQSLHNQKNTTQLSKAVADLTNNSQNVNTKTEEFSLSSLLSKDISKSGKVDEAKQISTAEAKSSGQIKETPRSLSGLLQSETFAELKEENSRVSKEAVKAQQESAMVKNISQKMNIAPELLLDIFSEDELAELDGGTATKLKVGDSEIITKSTSEDLGLTGDIKVKSELEHKITTSRTMMRNLVSDLKELMENYRPPVTKLSLTLNPNNMGEIDVTLIQRGNSMHINLSGNPTAVNLLASNSGELRNQLTDAGLSNHSFNFNGSQNGEENSRREEQRVRDLMKNISNPDDDENFASSLDLIVSEYA